VLTVVSTGPAPLTYRASLTDRGFVNLPGCYALLVIVDGEGFTTLPEDMHLVQTVILLLPPVGVTERTFLRFGFQRLRVVLCA